MNKPKIVATKGNNNFPKQEYFIKNPEKDFHTKYGFIKSSDLKKREGSKIKSSKGNDYFVFSPKFIDFYKRIRRYTQIIPLKDIGLIVAETGIGKNSVVIEAGCGSGGFSCFVSRLVKKIISYDINEKSIETIKENIKYLGVKNITIKKVNIYEKTEDKNADLFLIDVPEPWRAIKNANKSLKPSGFLVIYTPSISQMQNAMKEIEKFDELMPIKTVEVIEREWKVAGEIVRPTSKSNIHSGFISIIRKIGKND